MNNFESFTVKEFKEFYNNLEKETKHSMNNLLEMFIEESNPEDAKNIEVTIKKAYKHLNFETEIEIKNLNGFVNERRLLV